MLSSPDVKDQVVDQLVTSVSVPTLSASVKRFFIEWIVRKATPFVPSWIAALMSDASDGLSAEELKTHEDKITKEVSALIDFPFLEDMLIRPVVRSMLSYAAKGVCFPKV